MKILVVSSFLPYPLLSGGHIRLFNIIKQLSKKHKITLVCEKRDYQTQKDIEVLKSYCDKVITFDRKKQWSLANILMTGFSLYPFLMVGHLNSSMKQAIKSLIASEDFDLIHVETFYVMQNIPKTEIPVVLAEHNVEYLVYKHYVETVSLILRPFLYIDILKLKYWEEKFWRKATKVVAVSEADKKIMTKKIKDVEVVPNGVDLQKFRIQNSKFKINGGKRRILFIGDFRWIENRNSAWWILKDIWPRINFKFQISNFKLILWVVGRSIPDPIMKLTSDKNVIFDENAPFDTSLIYQKTDVLLAPIRVGGGSSFKILEAMATGTPVVTTKIGNEGIGAKEGEEILIANSSSEFADKIADVLKNEKLYIRVATNARRLIEKKYDWKMIVEKLEQVYQSVV